MSIVNSRLGTQVITYHSDLINIYNSSIGDETKIGTFTEIGGSDIGKNCVIGAYVFISPGCSIGNNVFIGPKCSFLNDLYPAIKGDDFIPTGVIVEDDAIIGANCVLLPGVRIGKGAKIAAGAVVTRDVEAGVTVLGFPARPRDDIWESPIQEERAKISEKERLTIYVGGEEGGTYICHPGESFEDCCNRLGIAVDVRGERRSATLNSNIDRIIDDMEETTDRLLGGLPEGSRLLNEEEIDKFVGKPLDPQFCGEVEEMIDDRKTLFDLEEDIKLSRTRRHTGKRLSEEKGNEYLGLNLGFRKESGIDKGGFDK